MIDSDLAALVAAALAVEKELEELDVKWKALKRRQEQLLEVDIPTLMDELEYTEVKSDEYSIAVEDEWTASISQDRKPFVCKMAEDLGCQSLVSNQLIMKFNKNERDMFEAARDLLIKNQQQFEEKQDINTGSWKKAVRELIAAGEPVDLAQACVTKLRTAVIKPIKKRL